MKVTRKILALLAVYSFVFYASVAGSYAATINAASASYSDVALAVSSANSGDTIVVPAGTATWDTRLDITKGITLQGAGIDKTVLINALNPADYGKYYPSFINYSPASPELNELFRVTGFTFDGNDNGCGIVIGNGSTTTYISNVRIDHNKFIDIRNPTYTMRAVRFSGLTYGLVDNNQFMDCRKCVDVYGQHWFSWNFPPVLGSDRYVVIEDNTISYPRGTEGPPTDAGHGGRYTFRYNTIYASNDYDLLDAHGNQEPVTEEYSPYGSRGTVTVEVYENRVYTTKTTGHRLISLRGGTCLVYNNTITGTAPFASITMTEEDCWRFKYVTEYPGYDKVKDTYIWGNTNNGITITPALGNELDADFIQEGRDYWTHAPTGYTPLQYPHPLAGTAAPGVPGTFSMAE